MKKGVKHTKRVYSKKTCGLNGGQVNVVSSSHPPPPSPHKMENTTKTKPSRTMKKMNCSPMIADTAISGSCYTPNILNMIKNAYNKTHEKEERISTNDTISVWKQLKEKLNCEKEDCWLNQIDDADLRKKIDRYVFAPDKPPEWNKNKNEWLSNYDIMNVLEQYEQKYSDFDFIGPTPIDFDTVLEKPRQCVFNALCNFDLEKHVQKGKTKIGIIFNLDEHDKNGSHWVSLFIDTNLGIIFYFDSAGNYIPDQINKFKNRVMTQNEKMGNTPMKFYQNAPNSHQRGTTECGVYSLFFIITMLTGKTEFDNNMTMKKRIHLFKKKRLDDAYIEKYRNIYFNG
jgi:hypothetical protein